MPHISCSATLTSGGGGCVGAVGLATAGLMNEDCTYAVTVMALQQLPQHRLGVVFGAAAPSPENSFLQPSGLVGPGHLMSMLRSEEHTSELQSLMRISYAVFCLKKKKKQTY